MLCCVFCLNDTSTTEIYTYLHTLSLHDALPISYVSRQVVDTITRAYMDQKPLFELIRRAGVVIASGHQVVTATLAAPPVAQRLEVKIGAPLLRIVRILNDASNRPVEYMDMLRSEECRVGKECVSTCGSRGLPCH